MLELSEQSEEVPEVQTKAHFGCIQYAHCGWYTPHIAHTAKGLDELDYICKGWLAWQR